MVRGRGEVALKGQVPPGGGVVAERLTLELAAPTRVVVAETADEVVVPGIEGYFGVLPGHAAFLTTLGTGEVMYRAGRDEHYLAVAGGVAGGRGDNGLILARTAQRPPETPRPAPPAHGE